MKLKALLLGSAAAMVAVTGARAADAVIAEPEPVEYVRVCDMYGAKWFYMPGTETCIQFDGYVRVTYGYSIDDRILVGDDSNAFWSYRARLNVRTRNETDYGTLEGWIRLQGNTAAPVDANVAVDRALISLAGFRLGYSDSYIVTHHGYGFYSDVQDGLYDYHQATFFDYTYSANGFSATIGVQQSGGSTGAAFSAEDLDIYAGVGYSGSWGGVAGSVIHDNLADEYSWKVSADLNIIEGLSIRGWYMQDDADTKYVTGSFGPFYAGNLDVEDQWGVAMQYRFNDMFAFRAGYTEANTVFRDLNADGIRDNVDTDYIHVGLDIRPVPGLIIRPEAAFADEGEQYTVRVYRTF